MEQPAHIQFDQELIRNMVFKIKTIDYDEKIQQTKHKK